MTPNENQMPAQRPASDRWPEVLRHIQTSCWTPPDPILKPPTTSPPPRWADPKAVQSEHATNEDPGRWVLKHANWRCDHALQQKRLPADQASPTQLLPDTSRAPKPEPIRTGSGFPWGRHQRKTTELGPRTTPFANLQAPRFGPLEAWPRLLGFAPVRTSPPQHCVGTPHGMMDQRSIPRPAKIHRRPFGPFRRPGHASNGPDRSRPATPRRSDRGGPLPKLGPRWPGPRRTCRCPKTPRPLATPPDRPSHQEFQAQGHRFRIQHTMPSSQPATEAKKSTSCHSGFVACPRIMLDP